MAPIGRRVHQRGAARGDALTGAHIKLDINLQFTLDFLNLFVQLGLLVAECEGFRPVLGKEAVHKDGQRERELAMDFFSFAGLPRAVAPVLSLVRRATSTAGAGTGLQRFLPRMHPGQTVWEKRTRCSCMVKTSGRAVNQTSLLAFARLPFGVVRPSIGDGAVYASSAVSKSPVCSMSTICVCHVRRRHTRMRPTVAWSCTLWFFLGCSSGPPTRSSW